MAPSTLYHVLRVEDGPNKYHHVRVAECKGGKTVNGGTCAVCKNTSDSLVDLHRADEKQTEKNIICEDCFVKISWFSWPKRATPSWQTVVYQEAVQMGDTASVFEAVDADAVDGMPPDPSQKLTVADVEYSLVSVVYLILGGVHYVTQFRLQGRWLKYDCMTGASSGFVSGSVGRRPPSTSQALLTGLRSAITERAQDLQQTLHEAMDEFPLTEDCPAMDLFRAAADQLNNAQHLATALATPLEMAEHFLFEFKAAASQSSQASTTPFQSLKALLRRNTNDATQAEATAIEGYPWNADIARHYRERAENLEGICAQNGDEHAVFVLLEADLELTTETTGLTPPGASHIHREAMNRLNELKQAIRDIPGKTRSLDAAATVIVDGLVSES
eukprot:g6094.t1